MKKIVVFAVLVCGPAMRLAAQSIIEAEKLSVPQSSAFKLVDVSPTLIETPATAKAFGLGVLQNFRTSGFAQNYSAELTPYWWMLPEKRNVYSFIGLKSRSNPVSQAKEWKMNPFAGLKFTNVSIAFLSKDMVPDTADVAQKVFSAGFRTTLVKAYPSGYASDLAGVIDRYSDWSKRDIEAWVTADPHYGRYQREENWDAIDALTQLYDSDSTKSAIKTAVDSLRRLLKNKLAEKPLVQWDLAGAYATYGIADTAWRTGRAGMWTSLSLNTPLSRDKNGTGVNYLSLAVYARYMYDSYTFSKDVVTASNSFDVGGRLLFQFEPLSVGVEAIHRNYRVEGELKSQRIVGFVNFRLTKDVYINGAFGNDFGMDKSRILALFGLNWGFGNEQLTF